ncbi:protein kinase [Williamsia sp. CHRR-6]|uniref:protein kinase domain-containing protein n=1 Tax=Williamsia sp. CHRR-6 TaxID=2835871 RepID=UPI001BDAF8A8|nr:protein kinase [Williamsia sp. CHRR-6]MBT0565284.1 serine/threonine protein kinase [Williamsia sp. CHRR-6]
MSTPPDPLLGARLDGRYRIDALIARGGMSGVYLGVDLRLDRPVAVKVMTPHYSADPQFLSRFEFEARSVARLKDPGLVAVYDQGHDGDYAFLVMELIEGGTLRELLRERGPMPPHAATAVLIPVLGGLGAAHAAGLVHRDIKPENVLISTSGEVKVADFGLVRAIAAAQITSNSVILGTAAYLSPEQVESAIADARSDVYATGILLFEMLTGTTPFTGDTTIALAYARLRHDVVPPSRVIAGVPREFDDVVLTATARDPAHRYADGADMLAAVIEVADRLALPPFTVPAPAVSAERTTAMAFRNRMGNQPATVDPGATRTGTAVIDPDHVDHLDDPTSRADADTGRRATRMMSAATHLAAEPTDPDDTAEPHPLRPQLMRAAAEFELARERGRRRAKIITAVVALLVVALAVAGYLAGVSLAGGSITGSPEIALVEVVAQAPTTLTATPAPLPTD